MSRQDGRERRVSDSTADDSGATILHVDLDAFFASVELLDRPDLKGRPVIVGNPDGRSVVTTATYEARAYGVGSAMPMARARQLCPSAVILPPRHDLYRRFSAQVMSIMDEITPVVERLSIDEAFLDVAGSRRLFGRPFDIGVMLRERVRQETGLTCSVGLAGTKFLAKLASGMAKPDGILVVPVEQTQAFLAPLPIRALWGVGGRTEQALTSLGIRVVSDLLDVPYAALRKAVGEAHAHRLRELAQGIDPRPVVTAREEKSVGHEETFHRDIDDVSVLERELLHLSDRVGARLRRAGRLAGAVSIKLRYADFSTLTRTRRLVEPSNVGRRIHEAAVGLFRDAHRPGQAVRLLGVRGESLSDGEQGLGLWDPDAEWRDAETTVDDVRTRFGLGAMRPASLLGRTATQVGGTRHGDEGEAT